MTRTEIAEKLSCIPEKDIELLKLLADSDEEMKERYAAWEKGE